MKYLPPFVVHRSHTLQSEQLKKYANDYRAVIELLRDSKINPEILNSTEYINEIIEQNA